MDEQPGRREPRDQRLFQLRRGQPAVIADGDRPSPFADHAAAEGPADGLVMIGRQSLADDAANVVLAQHRWIEVHGSGHCFAPSTQPHGRLLASGRPTET